MPFEYDPRKSGSNRAKHGIDFDEAQALWDDEESTLSQILNEIQAVLKEK